MKLTSKVNEPNSQVGRHTRYTTFIEPDRVVVVAYRLSHGEETRTATDYVQSKGLTNLNLTDCVVSISYAAAIDHHSLQTSRVLRRRLRQTADGRLLKCPIHVSTIDTHVRAALEHDCVGTDVVHQSNRLMCKQLRHFVRTLGVRGKRVPSGTLGLSQEQEGLSADKKLDE
jgi:hypothetical protein